MPHAFISHSKSDAELARRVAWGLESEGAPCWIAPRDIPPAEDYADALEAGVTEARVVVFLASHHSMTSRYCRAELEIARTDDVPILPVLLDDTPITGGWRIYLSGHQWLEGKGEEDAWIADLALALKRLGVREEDPSPGEGGGAASQDESDELEAILQRFEAYDQGTHARQLIAHMVSTGWTAHPPPNRQKTGTPHSYVRLTRTGQRRATAYVHSAAMFVAGKRERQILATSPSSYATASGIYIDHTSTRSGSLEAAANGADQLAAWADTPKPEQPEHPSPLAD